MEGEHAQMWQIPCKMTNSSSKPLQTQANGTSQEIPKKIPNLIKKKFQKLFHTLFPAINFPYFPMIFPLKPSIYRVQSSHV
jgi:hypothetical protein